MELRQALRRKRQPEQTRPQRRSGQSIRVVEDSRARGLLGLRCLSTDVLTGTCFVTTCYRDRRLSQITAVSCDSAQA